MHAVLRMVEAEPQVAYCISAWSPSAELDALVFGPDSAYNHRAFRDLCHLGTAPAASTRTEITGGLALKNRPRKDLTYPVFGQLLLIPSHSTPEPQAETAWRSAGQINSMYARGMTTRTSPWGQEAELYSAMYMRILSP